MATSRISPYRRDAVFALARAGHGAGGILYLLVASGCFAFGIYSWLEAVCRRIEP